MGSNIALKYLSLKSWSSEQNFLFTSSRTRVALFRAMDTSSICLKDSLEKKQELFDYERLNKAQLFAANICLHDKSLEEIEINQTKWQSKHHNIVESSQTTLVETSTNNFETLECSEKKLSKVATNKYG